MYATLREIAQSFRPSQNLLLELRPDISNSLASSVNVLLELLVELLAGVLRMTSDVQINHVSRMDSEIGVVRRFMHDLQHDSDRILVWHLLGEVQLDEFLLSLFVHIQVRVRTNGNLTVNVLWSRRFQ